MILVLFDIDGTLLSTDGAGRRAVAEAVSDVLGMKVDIGKISFSGRTDLAILADILEIADRPGESELLAACMTAYERALSASLRPADVAVYPGARELVDRLSRRSNVRLGLVTGNLRGTAYRKLQLAGLDGPFAVGAFGSDHADRNLLPELAARRAGAHFGHPFDADSTLVIGDTVHDVTCSRHYGARSVAVCTGYASAGDLRGAGPDLLLDSLDPGTDVDELIDAMVAGSS